MGVTTDEVMVIVEVPDEAAGLGELETGAGTSEGAEAPVKVG